MLTFTAPGRRNPTGPSAAAGVEGIVLLFSANDGSGPVYKFPAYDYFAPVLEPLLEEVSVVMPCML
jgi:hypothetical protein